MRQPTLVRALLLLFLACGNLSSCAANAIEGPRSYYVAPNGTSGGDGSLEQPWDLATALSERSGVGPGDTIWLRGGTYRGTFSANLNGTATAPIKVRQFPGERAVLDGGNSHLGIILDVSGSYTWYWGFEVTSSDPNRISAQSGSAPTDIGRGEGIGTSQTSSTGAGLKFIDLVIHDTAQGFGLWKEATDAEIYGCLIYYNGWTAPDRGHGHGVYVQNLTGTKRITNNVIFSNFSHGIQAFGSVNAPLDNIDVEGNTIFNNGMPSDYQRNLLVGGGSVAHDPAIKDNVLYYPASPGQNLNVGYEPFGVGAANPVITGNTIVNGDNGFSDRNSNVTMTGNFFYSSILYDPVTTLFPDNVYAAEKPSAPQVILRPNKYEPGRATITILNWTSAAKTPVDLSSLLASGTKYEIRNAQDMFAPPIASGTWNGSPVLLSTSNLPPAALAGAPTPPETGPELNVYVLLSGPAPRKLTPPAVRKR